MGELDRSRLQDPVYMAQQMAACEEELQKGIIGQREIIRQVMLAMLTGGNVLLEGMPGLGKTRLVSTISQVFDLSFKRIQFTPDLMPSDVTGTNIIVKNESGSSFSFERGPIFAHLILADEINRATPKTQSALLEAMQEHTVTVGNESHALAEPFFVLATQNPIENEGTYPLPEAQLDRFMFKILVRFPSKEELKGIVALTEGSGAPVIEKRMDGEGLLAARKLVNEIPIADAVMEYLLDIVMETHAPNPHIREGASPRAAQALVRAAKAKAFLEGRLNVSFKDVEEMAYPVLRHRVIPGFDAISEGIGEDDIIRNILKAKADSIRKA
ncbi:MAG: MoxR family ATPase [Clostridium sp.]|nr:MoxR family ATPase [Acetatifactor muris]MCM1526311.1 MoxR family ATPase [Bacteroides sp.]MCM1562872.1 MoxR family ATPase [Clostridium sp.]